MLGSLEAVSELEICMHVCQGALGTTAGAGRGWGGVGDKGSRGSALCLRIGVAPRVGPFLKKIVDFIWEGRNK